MPSENRAGPAWLVGDDDDQAAAQLPGRLASIFADLPAIIVVPDGGQLSSRLTRLRIATIPHMPVGATAAVPPALARTVETGKPSYRIEPVRAEVA